MPGIDEKKSEFRVRVQNPGKFDRKSFRYHSIGRTGCTRIIVACPKGKYRSGKCSVGMKTQAYRFKKPCYKSKEQVRSWLKRQHVKYQGVK